MILKHGTCSASLQKLSRFVGIFLVYWRRGQVVVTHVDGHLGRLLLALGLGHLAESVAELPKTEKVQS